MRTVFSLILLLIFSTFSHSQLAARPINAIGLGAYTIHHSDVFSFVSNTASIAQIKNPAAGIYGERRFMLKELNYYIGAAALPTRLGSFGLELNYYGFDLYNQSGIGLAYGRSLGSKLDIAVQFNYNALHIAGYGNAAAPGFKLGTILHLTDKLHAGFHITDPVGGKFGKGRSEKLPSVYTIGIGYDASEKFFCSIELVKEENQSANFEAAIQYQVIPRLLVKMGISTATSSVWMGTGLRFQSFRLDIISGYHPQLGITPAMSLIFYLKKKEN